MLCGGPPKLPSFKADSPLSTPFMKSIADLFRCISVTRFTQVIFKSRNLVTLRSRIAVLKRERGDFVTSGFIAIFKGCCIYYQWRKRLSYFFPSLQGKEIDQYHETS